MSSQQSFWDTRNATSSLAAASGHSHSGKPDGLTNDLSGPDPVPVPPSRRQVKAAGLMTLAISGRIGRNSSQSAALQSALENRLMTRLDSAGSTLFKLTWKRRRTPLGRSYLERQALVLRKSGSGCTSWPSPTAGTQRAPECPATREARGFHNGITLTDSAALAHWPTPDGAVHNLQDSTWEQRRSKAAETHGNNGFGLTIAQASSLAHWQTPQAHDTTTGGNTEADHHHSPHDLSNQSNLAHWATPTGPAPHDSTVSVGRGREPREGYGLDLASQAILSAWASPKEQDYKSASRPVENLAKQVAHPRGQDLSVEALCAAFGEMPNGFPADILRYPEQLSGGQLNPAHSFWLMGIPTEWLHFVSLAMQSLSRRRRSSSSHTSKRKGAAE